MNTYSRFCYQIIGRHIDELGFFSRLNHSLYQADMNLSPGMYLGTRIFFMIIAVIVILSGSIVLNLIPGMNVEFFPKIGSSSMFEVILSPFTILIMVVLGTAVGIPFSLTSKIQNKKMDIDQELPFALSHMSIISSTGASPVTVFTEIANSEHGKISEEFGKLVNSIEIEGLDVIAAMTKLAKSTPSSLLRSLLVDLTKIVHTGSSLESYFYDRMTRVMEMRRQIQREFIQDLSFYAEIYVTLVLMSTLIGILFVVLGGMLMGGTIGPFSAEVVFYIFIYFVIPMVNVIFGALLLLLFSRGG